ncbi:MAG: 2-phospho-L-lactate guanylyltransferase [Pseudomonadota bacterium]
MAQILMPLKDLVKAKTRLAGLLSASQRRALTQAMAEDLLAMLAQHSAISCIYLLSDDPSAHLLAARYGVQHLPDIALIDSTLNSQIRAAATDILTKSSDPLLIVHADLPLLSPADINAALALQQNIGGLVVGADRHRLGTNLLCFDRTCVPDFCFGENSCRRHLASAEARGFPAKMLLRHGIGLDVDEPADLAELMAALVHGQPSRTARLLATGELANRMAVSVPSIANPGPANRDVGEP